ncbi:hypothetical protein NKI48_25740 [Mesorhizobium sp. M0644]|uniref:hypothetical protein n=1 Tax=Mesorhizobium sp. M0644 TaxID=2956979 RepID=UPI003338F308
MKTVYDSDVSIDDVTIADLLTDVTFTELVDDFQYTREIVDVEQAAWVPYEEIARHCDQQCQCFWGRTLSIDEFAVVANSTLQLKSAIAGYDEKAVIDALRESLAVVSDDGQVELFTGLKSPSQSGGGESDDQRRKFAA